MPWLNIYHKYERTREVQELCLGSVYMFFSTLYVYNMNNTKMGRIKETYVIRQDLIFIYLFWKKLEENDTII